MLAAMANGLPVITKTGPATEPELRGLLRFADGREGALDHLDILQSGGEAAPDRSAQVRNILRQRSWEEVARRHCALYSSMLASSNLAAQSIRSSF
jgi:hypothetical protein